jgi:hypothetical protein
MKRTLSLPVLPTSLKLRRTGRSLGVVGILLCASALQAGPALSVLSSYPSEVKIEATATFKEHRDNDRPPRESSYTSYLPLEKSFFSLREKVEQFKSVSVSSSNHFTTALALLNVSRNGIYLTCTVQNEHEVYFKETWPLTIPFDQNFEETKELDLLDDAREKVKITIKSTITQ